MDPYALMRMSSLFAPPRRPPGFNLGQPAPPNPDTLNMGPPRPLPTNEDTTDPNDDESENNYFDLISKLSKPGPQMTAYQNMLKGLPREEDYQPTRGQKIAAAFSGFGAGVRNPAQGYETSKGIVQEPYETAVRRYGTRLGASGAGAQLERQSNLDQLRAVSQARALGLKYNEYELNLRKQRSTEDYQRGQIGVRHEANTVAAQRNTNTVAANNARIDIAKSNAETQKAAQRSLAAYHNTMATERKHFVDAYANRNTNKNISPTQQAQALQNALTMMKTDPTWSDFISVDGTTGIHSMAQDNGSRVYKRFKDELAKKVNAMIKSGTIMPDENDEEDDDDPFEIIEQ